MRDFMACVAACLILMGAGALIASGNLAVIGLCVFILLCAFFAVGAYAVDAWTERDL